MLSTQSDYDPSFNSLPPADADDEREGDTELNEDRWGDEEELVAFYEERFQLPRERNYRKPREPKNVHVKHQEHREAVESLAAEPDLQAHWETTYTPARFEGGWLQDSLRPFYEMDLIVDIMAQIKGGKEASVYRCRPHHSIPGEWVAAKIYRPRKLRNLRNDAMYREGRLILTEEDGKPANRLDDRTVRAIGKKSTYGVQVQHTSWLMYEYKTLEQLAALGAAVPRTLAVGSNAILMGYVGDESRAAPTLHEVRLEANEVQPLFDETMRNVELMLENGLIHGDLSAYNILYWEGKITLIDFPQVTQAETNRNAKMILRRDVTRVCEYFGGYGLQIDANQIAEDLWDRYAAPDPMDLMADLSTLAAEDE